MFVNFSGRGNGGGSLGEAIQAAISQMMGGGNGTKFDSGPFKRARNTLHRALEQDHLRMIESRSWDRVRWAEEILKIDPTVRGCCGDPHCETDQAFRTARKRMSLWTTEEAVSEAVQEQIPAIAQAVEGRLMRQLPDMMEQAATRALEKARQNVWYRRAIRAVLGFLVEFFFVAFTWHAISKSIDEQLEESSGEIEEHGMTTAQLKRLFIFHEGWAFTLGYYIGGFFGWTLTLAVIAGIGWLIYSFLDVLHILLGGWLNLLWTALGVSLAVFAIKLWRDPDYREQVADSVGSWWEYHITDTLNAVRNWEDFEEDDLSDRDDYEWYFAAAVNTGRWFATSTNWVARSSRWVTNAYSNRRFHPIAWVRTHWPRKNNDAASTEE